MNHPLRRTYNLFAAVLVLTSAVVIPAQACAGEPGKAIPPEDPASPVHPRKFGLPGGVGPTRGWYIWRKFDAERWTAEVCHEATGENFTVRQVETFSVQPKFEGSALDFGMVIPTPSQPKLHEMPHDCFKHLAVYSIMKKREFPQSKLLTVYRPVGGVNGGLLAGRAGIWGHLPPEKRQHKHTAVELEAGVVGSLDYKIIADDAN